VEWDQKKLELLDSIWRYCRC